MNRLDRVSAILIQLQSKKVLRAQEIADRFEVSLRTVYRDMASIYEAGVPLSGEAGTGYSLVEGYTLPPIAFTPDEVMALLTAEKLVGKLTDTKTAKNHQAAMFKIKALLKTQSKEMVDLIEDKMMVMPRAFEETKFLKNQFFQTILKAISEDNALNINYITIIAKKESQRIVEPVGLYFSFDNWYLIAFCRLRNDYRNFRLDQIQTVDVLNEKIRFDHPKLEDFLKRVRSENNDLQEVIVRINNSSRSFIGNQKYYMGFVSETQTEQYLEMRFLTGHLEGMSRWLMMFAGNFEIIKPESLKTLVRKNAENILKVC